MGGHTDSSLKIIKLDDAFALKKEDENMARLQQIAQHIPARRCNL